jgi:transposase
VPGVAGTEVTDEPAEVISRAAAVDVAKGSGMVCLRLPHESRAGRRTQAVWEVPAAFAAVVALMDYLVCQGVERLVLESTSDYWRIWYYLAEAAGLEVWLVNARDVRHLPGRAKSDRLDCVWLCKLNERGMLRRSFVPPEPVRDLRALTRLRANLTHDRVRHQNRIEKILEDALLKVSSVISDLMGASGRRFLQALVDGERSPAALAALGDPRLHAGKAELKEALTGRFRDIHAIEIGMLLELADELSAKITVLDAKIAALMQDLPGLGGACTSCGQAGGSQAGACAGCGDPVLSTTDRLDELPGTGLAAAQIILAELGTDMSQFPTPGHAAAWAKLTALNIQSGNTRKAGHTGKGNPCLRGVLGAAVMAIAKTGTYLGEKYRRLARRIGKQKAIVAVARTLLELAYRIIADPGFRYIELGSGYHDQLDAERKTRARIREIERINPGKTVTLTLSEPAAPPPQPAA